MLDMKGRLAGISCGKYLDTSVEGMCFAIPISSAQPILNDIIAGKKTKKTGGAYLGIIGQDVSESAASVYNIPVGVYISSVEKGTSAEAAKLQKGDVITAFDGTEITQMTELRGLIAGKKAGDKVKLTYSRSNNGVYESKDITVTLGERPDTEEDTKE
jgi:serine protease Do